MRVANQQAQAKVHVTLNSKLSGIKPEIRQLHGRDHYVVPTVMMVEGVHNGSAGAGFYSADVMRKVDIAWNSKPIVLGHPKSPQGDPLLASSADVLNEFQVGILCNTSTGEDCRQVSEAWLDKSLLETKDPALATSVANGEIVEVSTGYYLEADMTQGVWNSENYAWKACNLQPDHFAILPAGVSGACSVSDGAGLCRNEEGKGADESTAQGVENQKLQIPDGISLDGVTEAVAREIYSRYPDNETTGTYTYVVEVFPTYAIFRTSGDLFSITWALDADGKVSLGMTATPVKKEVTYTPIGNSAMTKEQKVAAIIAANKGFGAGQQAELLSLNEATLDAIHTTVTAKSPVVNEVGGLAAVTTPELNSQIQAALAIRNQQRQGHITTILASNTAGVTQADLEALPDSALAGMAALATKAANASQAQAAAAAPTGQQVGNQQQAPQVFTPGIGTFGLPMGSAPMLAANAAGQSGPAMPAGFAPSLPSYIAKKA